MQIPLSSGRSLFSLSVASRTGFGFFASTAFPRPAPAGASHPAGGRPRLDLSLRRAIQTIGMVDYEPDEPDAKRSRLDLEDGASQETAQPLRERTVVAPPPSTSKALKSVLKGTFMRLTHQQQAWKFYNLLQIEARNALALTGSLICHSLHHQDREQLCTSMADATSEIIHRISFRVRQQKTLHPHKLACGMEVPLLCCSDWGLTMQFPGSWTPDCKSNGVICCQVTNATTIQVRRPGNPRKWRARILCEGRLCDLALLTVDEDEFWADAFMVLQFDDVPQLQVRASSKPVGISCRHV